MAGARTLDESDLTDPDLVKWVTLHAWPRCLVVRSLANLTEAAYDRLR